KCISIQPNQRWASMWRNEHDREIVMRLNRTNVALRYRKWIVYPENLKHVNYMQLSPLPEHMNTDGKKLILVDLRVFAFGAYDEQGDLVYWGPASGGKTYCYDTKEDCRSAAGNFKIYRVQGEECMSSKYPVDRGGGAPMPYCMHYYKGYAIHGSTLAGFVNGSRGCIRLFYSDAKWLNQDFAGIGTEVIVKR
ncbi:MAG: L,D-transpeptidase, partial [Coxiellaceae bacterium]|nr:L,D-transpeptidase [Coxiellaceae bacterium]